MAARRVNLLRQQGLARQVAASTIALFFFFARSCLTVPLCSAPPAETAIFLLLVLRVAQWRCVRPV